MVLHPVTSRIYIPAYYLLANQPLNSKDCCTDFLRLILAHEQFCSCEFMGLGQPNNKNIVVLLKFWDTVKQSVKLCNDK